MHKSEDNKNKERKDKAMRDLSSNLPKSDQKYCNEIINFSEQVFTVLDNKGGVKITLRKDNTDICNCSIYLEINKEPCPLFETSTLKELRNKLKSFLDFATQLKLKGIEEICNFLNELQNHNANDSIDECNIRMLSIDLMVFVGTFIMPKPTAGFGDIKSPIIH